MAGWNVDTGSEMIYLSQSFFDCQSKNLSLGIRDFGVRLLKWWYETALEAFLCLAAYRSDSIQSGLAADKFGRNL